jgi:hypothetical protein
MKKQADKSRSERSFEVGESVFLKLQPYVQSSFAPRSNQKLAFKFFRPYKIIAKVGSVAYKLDLPTSSSIHLVFHASQLKKVVSGNVEVTPDVTADIDSLRVPEAILQKKVVNRGVNPVTQVLIKWSNWPSSLATWEDLERLQQRFPSAPAWGQATFQGGGMLTPPLLGLVGVTDLLGPTVESWARSGRSGLSSAGLSPCNLLAVSYVCACCLWLYVLSRREWRINLYEHNFCDESFPLPFYSADLILISQFSYSFLC